MDITAIFTAQLKAALKSGQQSLSLDEGATVKTAIQTLAAAHPDEFAQYVLQDDQLLPSMILCVNDRQVSFDHADALHHGDTLTLLSAISGG